MDLAQLIEHFRGERKPSQDLQLSGRGAPGTVPLRGMERLTVNETREPIPEEVFQQLLGRAQTIPGIAEQEESTDQLQGISNMIRSGGVQLDASPVAGFIKGVLGRDVGYKAPQSAESVVGSLAEIQKLIGGSQSNRANDILKGMNMGMTEKKTTVAETMADKQVPQGRAGPKLDMKGFGDRMAKDGVAASIEALQNVEKVIPGIYDANDNSIIPGFDQTAQLNPFKKGFSVPDTWQPSVTQGNKQALLNQQAVEELSAGLRNQLFGATLTAGEAAAWDKKLGTAAGQGPKSLRSAMRQFNAVVRERLASRESAQPEEANQFRQTFEQANRKEAPLSTHSVFNMEGRQSAPQAAPQAAPAPDAAKDRRYEEWKIKNGRGGARPK